MKQLMSIIGQSSGRSFVSDNWDYIISQWPLISSLGKKDVRLCIEAARAKEVTMPLVEARFLVDWELSQSERSHAQSDQ
jgi:3-hydroxyisobutyrate dehydrogenase-like beta-hydroxyacid dehydrogenase